MNKIIFPVTDLTINDEITLNNIFIDKNSNFFDNYCNLKKMLYLCRLFHGLEKKIYRKNSDGM